ncbi:MAG: class I SAM-dependent RNA methyltransferase [Lachnospiraceae bacterium]|nr:class I SAM-dependent RNA methyltransferase [Lachnospiraceae bacterium]
MEYKKNDYLTVKIEDMSNEGEGIGKVDGFTLFVKDTVIGDKARVKLIKVKKNYAFARLEEIIEPSADRVDAVCPVHRQCGGCQLQSMSYESQLRFKQNKVRNNLIRIGGFTENFVDSVMESIVGMEESFHYRNKAQYPVGTDKEGNPVAGFYAGRTHSIIPNLDCALGVPENAEILKIILEHMKAYGIPAYDEVTGQGLVRHVLIRKGFTSGEIMVCLVLNWRGATKKEVKKEKIKEKVTSGHSETKEKVAFGRSEAKEEFLTGQQELIDKLVKVKGMTSISVSINTEQTNVIMGREIHTLWGNATISDTIHVRDMQKEGYPFTGQELTFHISPLSFYQVNPVQTEKLYSLALEYAGLTGKETVWDLYCGIGTISLFLAGHAGKVCGVEIVPQAIDDAKKNARRNGIENAEFYVGKAEEVLPEFYERLSRTADAAGEDAKKGRHHADVVEREALENGEHHADGAGQDMLHPDVIVVDPPRKGCDEACLDTMLKMRPGRIVYVSCDSATLARDLKVLCEGGYEVKKVRAVDQFGMTVHVETCCLLERLRNAKDHVTFTLGMEDYYRIKDAETDKKNDSKN